MAIERDPTIKFHEQGTLNHVTRWITAHDEGLAEWLKNARRAYQADRANVRENHRATVILFADGTSKSPPRIGLLDVGGATVEDITRWSIWQDPEASSRGSPLPEEETQGNGGKAYMYRLFSGPARILGVRDGRLNCKGLEGPANSLERGIPGFMPDVANGREMPISDWRPHLQQALAPYDTYFEFLPEEVQLAIEERKAFTLVEGEDPRNLYLYKGRIPADELVRNSAQRVRYWQPPRPHDRQCWRRRPRHRRRLGADPS